MEKRNNRIAVILAVILAAAGIVLTVWQAAADPEARLESLIAVAMYVIALFYILAGYRIPHSDLLRYSLLAYAVLLGVLFIADSVLPWVRIVAVICAILVAYMAGRLNKPKESLSIISTVLIILVLLAIAQFVKIAGEPVPVVTKILAFNQPVIWLCFCMAYLTRFRAHKEAGESSQA